MTVTVKTVAKGWVSKWLFTGDLGKYPNSSIGTDELN